jgi:hypothetical protein
LSVKVLARLFRGKFLAGVKEAYHAGELALGGSVAALAEPEVFRRWLDALYRQGNSTAMRPVMMAMTTNSAISVKMPRIAPRTGVEVRTKISGHLSLEKQVTGIDLRPPVTCHQERLTTNPGCLPSATRLFRDRM